MQTARSRIIALLLTVACLAPVQSFALQTRPLAMRPLFLANPSSPADEAIQTRRLDTSPATVYAGCVVVLGDMGYTLVEGVPRIGIVAAYREADVTGAGVAHAAAEAALVTTTLLLSLLIGEDMVMDLPEQVAQIIYVSILVSPAPDETHGAVVRVSIDRDLVYDNNRGIRPDHTELPAVYAEFFERLERAVFLEDQQQ